MRIPLNPAGGREMAIITLLFGGSAAAVFVLAASGFAWCWPAGALLTLIWMAGLAFFRDFERQIPNQPGTMVAPADGKVVEISDLDHHDDIGGPARRIGIFLSILDVHVNRSPCAGVVQAIRYKPGRFLDARNQGSSQLNESNTIVIDPDEPDEGPVVVRQVAGLIARRVVCNIKVGDRLEKGQRIGMLKFGSRTELIVPEKSRYIPAVKHAEWVCGGVTILARQRTGNVRNDHSIAAMESLNHAQACSRS